MTVTFCWRVLVHYAGLAWAPIIVAPDEATARAKAQTIIAEQRSANFAAVDDYGFSVDGVELIHCPGDRAHLFTGH